MIGPGIQKLHGQLKLNTATDTTLPNKDIYTKITGVFTDGEAKGFIVSNNNLIYTGPSGVVFLFNGSSDVEVNQACQIYYGLHINDNLVEDAQTPHDFVNPSKVAHIGITALIKLNQGDVLNAYVKSDTDNTIVSVKTFDITLWG